MPAAIHGLKYRDPSGGNLYFVADDGVHGRVRKSDGTVGGTDTLKDVCEDCPFSSKAILARYSPRYQDTLRRYTDE